MAGAGGGTLGSAALETANVPETRLAAIDNLQLRPVLLSLEDRRLPLPRKILELLASNNASWNSRRCSSLISDRGG
jgi:hypothetical protein